MLLELSGQAGAPVEGLAEELIGAAMEAGEVEDAAIAASIEQRKALWRIRETIPDAQRGEGVSIKHDISVPVANVPRFLEEADAAVKKLIPGVRTLGFGHVGDGNVHYNVFQPPGSDGAAFLARWHEIGAVVYEVVGRLGGSISAEHGVGQMKRDLLPFVKDPVALDLMRALKRTLDPQGILNPGKVRLKPDAERAICASSGLVDGRGMHPTAFADYKNALLFLVTAGVIVPLFRRLKVSPVIGFLAAGVALGPFGLGRLAQAPGWFGPRRQLARLCDDRRCERDRPGRRARRRLPAVHDRPRALLRAPDAHAPRAVRPRRHASPRLGRA